MSLRNRIQIILAFLACIPLLLLLYESYRASRHTLLEQMKQGSLQTAQLSQPVIRSHHYPSPSNTGRTGPAICGG